MADYYELCDMINSSKNNQYSLFTEAYFGRTPEIETILNVMRKIVKYVNTREDYMSITFTPLNKMLEDAMQKAFGFKRVECVWVNTGTVTANGGTFVGVTTLIHHKSLKPLPNNKGYYDISHVHEFLIMMSPAFIRDMGLTAEEVTAILLHEIGHNFDTSPCIIMNILASMCAAFYNLFSSSITNFATRSLKSILTGNGPIKDSKVVDITHTQLMDTLKNQSIAEVIQNIPVLDKLYIKCMKFSEYIFYKIPKLNDVRKIYFIGKDLVYTAARVVTIISDLVLLPINIVLSPVVSLFYTPLRKMEIFADSFAAAYGFGPELASGLRKSELSGALIYKNGEINTTMINNPLLRFTVDLNQADYYFITLLLDTGHGTHQSRMVKIIKKLRRELNDINCSKTSKAELLSQIETLEKNLDEYNRGEVGDKRLVFSSFLRGVMMKLFKGDTDIVTNIFPMHEA